MESKYYFLIPAIFIFASLCFLSCDEDCPNCPEGIAPQPPISHRIYAFDDMNGFIMSVDYPADTIVDSIRVDFYGWGIFITPDGERLLVTNSSGSHTMEIYRTADLSHIGSLNQFGDYFFDGGDDYGIWLPLTGNKFYFIDGASLLPTGAINRPAYYGFLDTLSNTFFALSANDGRIIYRVDCDLRKIADSIVMPVGVSLDFVYSRAANSIFFFGGKWLLAYGLEDHEIDTLDNDYYFYKSLGISSDGKLLCVTDGGDALFGYSPVNDMVFYDAVTRELMPTFAQDFSFFGQLLPYFFGKPLFAPDNSLVFVGSFPGSGGCTPLCFVDPEGPVITDVISPFECFDATAIALGPIPTEIAGK